MADIKGIPAKCTKCGHMLNDYEIQRLWCVSCNTRYASADELFKDNEEYIRRKQAETQRVVAAQKIVVEANNKACEINDVYEYDVIVIPDMSDGSVNITAIKRHLEEHGKAGWRLVSSYTNEVGVNSSSSGGFGFTSGTNATIDNTVMIFERCVKRYKNQ